MNAFYKIDGVDQGFCPRCGDSTQKVTHGGLAGHPADCDGSCGV